MRERSVVHRGDLVSVGGAFVDVTTRTSEGFPPPPQRLAEFASANREGWAASGATLNTTTMLADYTGRNCIMYATVGNDALGRFFIDSIGNKGLRSGIQMLDTDDAGKPIETGAVAILLDEDGRHSATQSFFGGALNIHIPRAQQRNRDIALFLTGSSTFREGIDGTAIREIKTFTDELQEPNSLFALNLSATHPAKTTIENLLASIEHLGITPDIVVGNEHEALYATGEDTPEKAIMKLFPTSPLVAVTLADQGSLLRLNGYDELIKIDAVPCTVKHPTGAGDGYMALLVGGLCEYPQDEWTPELVRKVANMASEGASMIVGSSEPRLSAKEITALKEKHFPTEE